jgi:hypothetical protein
MPTHVILDNASLKIGTAATAAALKELACWTNHIELSPDTATTTVDTMCGSIDYPGTTKWSLVATLYQSFDVGGPEEVLAPLVTAGVPCWFVIAADRVAPISATNPGWQGQVQPMPYAPLNGDAGEPSEIELEWGLVAAPTKITTPPVLLAAGTTHAELDEAAEAAGHEWSKSGLTVAEKQAELEAAGAAA